tara:strand:- start:659 stop:811 length:153 start_codon:yes stop_codon:yes gene_type:complete
MAPTIISILTLGIAILFISTLWITTTLKEGEKAIEENNNKNSEKKGSQYQ